MKNDEELSIIGKVTNMYAEAVWLGTQRGLDRVNLRKKIANRIKELRNNNKLTQEEISIKIDTNVLTYRGYENIKSDIPVLLLIRLADLYNVSLDYITCRTDNMTGLYSNQNEASDKDIKNRLAKLEDIINKFENSQK